VNPVRSGRKQPQQLNRVPGRGWLAPSPDAGHHHQEVL